MIRELIHPKDLLMSAVFAGHFRDEDKFKTAKAQFGDLFDNFNESYLELMHYIFRLSKSRILGSITMTRDINLNPSEWPWPNESISSNDFRWLPFTSAMALLCGTLYHCEQFGIRVATKQEIPHPFVLINNYPISVVGTNPVVSKAELLDATTMYLKTWVILERTAGGNHDAITLPSWVIADLGYSRATA